MPAIRTGEDDLENTSSPNLTGRRILSKALALSATSRVQSPVASTTRTITPVTASSSIYEPDETSLTPGPVALHLGDSISRSVLSDLTSLAASESRYSTPTVVPTFEESLRVTSYDLVVTGTTDANIPHVSSWQTKKAYVIAGSQVLGEALERNQDVVDKHFTLSANKSGPAALTLANTSPVGLKVILLAMQGDLREVKNLYPDGLPIDVAVEVVYVGVKLKIKSLISIEDDIYKTWINDAPVFFFSVAYALSWARGMELAARLCAARGVGQFEVRLAEAQYTVTSPSAMNVLLNYVERTRERVAGVVEVRKLLGDVSVHIPWCAESDFCFMECRHSEGRLVPVHLAQSRTVHVGRWFKDMMVCLLTQLKARPSEDILVDGTYFGKFLVEAHDYCRHEECIVRQLGDVKRFVDLLAAKVRSIRENVSEHCCALHHWLTNTADCPGVGRSRTCSLSCDHAVGRSQSSHFLSAKFLPKSESDHAPASDTLFLSYLFVCI